MDWAKPLGRRNEVSKSQGLKYENGAELYETGTSGIGFPEKDVIERRSR